jgi:hypothetical protein
MKNSDMKRPLNPNNHKRTTPDTSGSKRKDDKRFTSYDTSQNQTDSPQKAREEFEPEGEQARLEKTKKES